MYGFNRRNAVAVQVMRVVAIAAGWLGWEIRSIEVCRHSVYLKLRHGTRKLAVRISDHPSGTWEYGRKAVSVRVDRAKSVVGCLRELMRRLGGRAAVVRWKSGPIVELRA